jgi:F420-non-reducing hydrogenase iron-sulfur subunit
MVEPTYILKALDGGADGVLLAGCRPGDCHYISGNLKAERMVEGLRVLLRRLGLEEERLRLRWISAGEGGLFAKTIEEMVAQLKEKGPSRLKKSKEGISGI